MFFESTRNGLPKSRTLLKECLGEEYVLSRIREVFAVLVKTGNNFSERCTTTIQKFYRNSGKLENDSNTGDLKKGGTLPELQHFGGCQAIFRAQEVNALRTKHEATGYHI